MGTETRLPVLDGDSVPVGTSLFHRRTREVAWVTEARDGVVRLETVTGPFEMETERFERRLDDGDIVVEVRPPVAAEETASSD